MRSSTTRPCTRIFAGSARPEAAGVGDYVGLSGPALAPSGWIDGERGFANDEGCHEFQWSISDVVDAVLTAGLRLEQQYDITPAALAFGLRVLTDPAARAAVADLGRRTGHVPSGPGAGRALDFEKERALRALGRG